jgi:hypothetical protein
MKEIPLDTITLAAADAPATIPGFDPAAFMTGIAGTAGTWFGVALAVGLGAGLLATIALIAVGRLRKALGK